MAFRLTLAALMAFLALASAITMDRCSLARRMNALGVPRSELPQWVCIAEHESHYRTHVVGPPNTDGSNDYGIFQINDRYWCQPSSGKFSYNYCEINCDELLTSDISVAVRCARHIKADSGFKAWATWHFCNGYLPSIDDCFTSFGNHIWMDGKSEF